MEKNYNYNFENRSKIKKTTVVSSNLSIFSCSANDLKKSPVSNGKLWHTTDTNEFYYDWNGKRTKLNVTGDSDSVNAEIAKIKSDIAKLNPDAVQQKVNTLEGKVNTAVSTVNNLKTQVNSAVSSANAASQAAQDAAAQVADKADKDYVDSKISDTKGYVDSVVDTALAGINIPDVSGLAKQSDVDDLNTRKADVSAVNDLIDNALATIEVPTKVSELTNDSGYLTEHQSLDEYAKKADIPDVSGKADISQVNTLIDSAISTIEIPDVPTTVSSFTNDAGYITENDIPEVTTGSFPEAESADSPTATSNGFATVQDVMDYVNALIEKKKDELTPSGEVKDYLYVNGVSYTDDNVLPTPGTIYDMNCYEISDDLISDGLKVYVGPEILGFDEGNPTTTIYSEVFSVDLPTGYSIEVHNWDSDNNKWFDAVQPMISNPKQATKLYGGKTYNCFVRKLDDNFNDALPVNVRYKIIINKN